MLKKNWPYSETCSFCLCMFETTLLECNYTEAVWNIVAGKFGLPGYGFLSHSEGPLIRMDSANCRIWQQKRKKEKPWHLVHFLVDDVERKEQEDF
jgi:hypothetical protein